MYRYIGTDAMTSLKVKNRHRYEFERDVSIIDALIRNRGPDIHQNTVYQYKQDNNNIIQTMARIHSMHKLSNYIHKLLLLSIRFAVIAYIIVKWFFFFLGCCSRINNTISSTDRYEDGSINAFNLIGLWFIYYYNVYAYSIM